MVFSNVKHFYINFSFRVLFDNSFSTIIYQTREQSQGNVLQENSFNEVACFVTVLSFCADWMPFGWDTVWKRWGTDDGQPLPAEYSASKSNSRGKQWKHVPHWISGDEKSRWTLHEAGKIWQRMRFWQLHPPVPSRMLLKLHNNIDKCFFCSIFLKI